MNNVAKIKNCFGCGVCAASCPINIISITLNMDGFYEPSIIKTDKCINCGICLDVCSFNNYGLALKEDEIHSWAAWSNDERIREICSSGGIGYEIGRQLIDKGYLAVGCRYNVDNAIAEHFIASSKEEFYQSIGSKYIQSYTVDALKSIKKKNQKYLITGTPCQIDSFRRMIRKFKCEENFILMDFFCHCVPSMNAWKAYIKMWQKKIGQINYLSWRNKYKVGWHDSWNMCINIEKPSITQTHSLDIFECEPKIQSRWSKGDLFYKLFLGDICQGPQCQKQCKFKYRNSSADIRIGDLWGKVYQNDEKGVSALITFTPIGAEVISNLINVSLISHSFDTVAEGQMKENAKAKELYRLVMWYLRKEFPINSPIFKGILLMQRIINRIKYLLRK